MAATRTERAIDLRISGRVDADDSPARSGSGCRGKASAQARSSAERPTALYDVDMTVRLVERVGRRHRAHVQPDEPRTTRTSSTASSCAIAREYLHLDNSACNLAWMNLLKFLDDDALRRRRLPPYGRGGVHRPGDPGRARRLSDREIGETTRAFRQLGLGYANLGALLMALGLPYDSDDGRAWAGAITSLMAGHAYATSARIAAGWARSTVRRQRGAHAAGARHAPRASRQIAEATSCRRAVARAAQRGVGHGVARRRGARRAQLPGGGAGAHRHDRLHDGLRHDRHRARPRAGEDEEARRRRHDVDRQPDGPAGARRPRLRRPTRSTTSSPTSTSDKSILGAPHLAPAHLPVFACSMGDNTIHYEGHVRMMAAVQPFLSAASPRP